MRGRKTFSGLTMTALVVWGILATDAAMAAANLTSAKDWLRISAFTNKPLANAYVLVFSSDGKLLLAEPYAANPRGFYPAKIENLPQAFPVVVIWNPDSQANESSLRLLGLAEGCVAQSFARTSVSFRTNRGARPNPTA